MRHAHQVTRREFLRKYGIASSALTLSPYFIERFSSVCHAASYLTRVYKVTNGDPFQNIAKLLEMAGGISRFIGPTDIVIIKANGQWPNQGYTHTGCIKGVIDAVLAIPGFSGEVLICDNIQNYGATGQFGFDATTAYRTHNWPDHNWNSLAADYAAKGKPVATKRWVNSNDWRALPSPPPCFLPWDPSGGEGWSRYFFSYNGQPTYLSCPIFSSPLTAGRMIDMKNGVWESGAYTGRRVRAICMPTLNNHGAGSNEDVGITSAIKSFFGATEIHTGVSGVWNGYRNIHSSGNYITTLFSKACGELPGVFINTLYSPVLYLTAAMWAGWYSRTGAAAETKTVLACENPVTLDYIASRDVISPYASWLNPDQDTHTRQQILGCNGQGIGTIDPSQFEVITYDFNNPTANRLDVERKIRDFKSGNASEQEVKDMIQLYMQSDN
jgi:hypothetical protein